MSKPQVKQIQVNHQKLRSNLKNGTNDPVISVRQGSKVSYGHRVKILGDSEIVYQPDNPLKCGARCWIETTAEVAIS